MSVTAGQRLGPHEILSTLGADGMGEVLMIKPGTQQTLSMVVVLNWLEEQKAKLPVKWLARGRVLILTARQIDIAKLRRGVRV